MPATKYKARELLLPFIEVNKNRHGRLRYYFRPKDRKGVRIRLPDDYKSAAFMAAYDAARAGAPLPAVADTIALRTPFNSFGWAIKLYLASDDFKNGFADSTQAARRRQLEKIAREKGGVSLNAINQASIEHAMSTRPVHEANSLLTTLKGLFAWAMKTRVPNSNGELKAIKTDNPTKLVETVKPPKKAKRKAGEADDPELDDKGHPTLTDEQMVAFEAAYGPETYERLAYEVLLCTGLRVGDAARLGRQHVKGDVIALRTEKTNTPVALRILPRLKHALERGPKGAPGELALLTTTRGKAYDKNYLGRIVGEAFRKIGLPHTAHSLRKTAARRYIEAGADNAQLKAIFGWTTSAMVDKYTRMFNRRKVALGAMDDFVLDKAFAPTPFLGEGNAEISA